MKAKRGTDKPNFLNVTRMTCVQANVKHSSIIKTKCAYFHVLDHASTTFQLNIKEAIHIQREQPPLNQQLHHVKKVCNQEVQ